MKDVQEIAIEPGALTISDTIKANGQLEPKLDMTKLSSDVPQGLQFVWYRRSGENSEWTKVERRCVTGEQYNVAEDGSWLNAALDKGADTDYRVQLVTADGSVIYGTDKEPVQAIYHVPYYDQLQNGDFESPKIPADADAYNEHYQPLLPNGTAGMVWKTTASDSKIEFVSVASRAFKEISEKWHDCGEAANGTQFVELNATQPGALYQDVLTTPGSKMYWSLAHRGRNGSDTMYVIIMSTEKAEAANITSQSQVQTVLGDPEAYGATIWEITSSNDQWYVWNSFSAALYPSGENATDGYTVPEGQYLTRYFFVAGDTAYDQKYDADPSLKGTVGNHLDDVHFSTELPPPAAGKVNLEITKTITRLEYDKLPETLKFSVSGFHNDSITLDKSAFMLDANGNYTATWKKQYNIGYFSSAQFTVSEDTASAQISGFDLTTSVAVNDSVPAAGSTAPITIQDQGRGKITFTNAYIQKTADFQLAKVDRQNQPLADAIFKLEAQTQDNIWEQVGTLLRTDSNGKASCDVTYDTLYRITEVEAPDGYLPLAASAYFKVKFVNGEGTLQPYDEAGNPAQWPDGFQVLPYDVMELKAINSKGVILPETGGMGTGLYYLGGAALILAACITGYLGKRKTRRRA